MVIQNRSGMEISNIQIHVNTGTDSEEVGRISSLKPNKVVSVRLGKIKLVGDYGYQISLTSQGHIWTARFGYGPSGRKIVLVISNNVTFFSSSSDPEILDIPPHGLVLVHWYE